MKPLPYNDDWIKANCDKAHSYRQLAEDHNSLFGTNFTREQMKNHVGGILKIRMNHYFYTEEMVDWIAENFPKTGTAEDKAKAFNKRFGTDRTGADIKEKARRMGVTLSPEALADYKRKSAEHIALHNTTIKAKPIGYVGRPSNGYLMVKTKQGWISQARYEYAKAYGKIPKGCVVIYLDGDNTNANPDNLMAIPQGWQAVMTANKFWSEHPKITYSGIVWCKLYELLKQQERSK